MRIARKVYMSIFTTLFILITCVATTFAWVGMFTTATLGSFDLNIKAVNIDAEYFLKISNTGLPNSFDNAVDANDLKKQILNNMGYSTDNILDEGIDAYFSKFAIMEPVTTDSTLSDFYSLKGATEKNPYLSSDNRYYKFDLYLSIDTLNGIANTPLDELPGLKINANVFFDNIKDAIEGTLNTESLLNTNPFSAIPSNSFNSDYICLRDINASSLTINAKNATRLAFQVFEPIAMNASYTGLETPKNTVIYQAGKQLPSVKNGVYDLGGILPEEYNLALKELNKSLDINVNLNNLYVDSNKNGTIDPSEKTYYQGAYDRYLNNSDIEMIESNNVVWDNPDEADMSGTNYLGIQNGVQTKMKISVYFWFEGFDADCLRLVDYMPTSLGLVFATDKTNI